MSKVLQQSVTRFPGEDEVYRTARDQLLEAEIELKRRVEEVAALRRRLPLGGESCTSILDSLDGTAPHARQRVNLVVVAKSPIERIRQHARDRGWTNLRLLSSAATTYNQDYQAETPDGDQIPALNVFVRRNGKIHHFYNTEMLYVAPEPGQDPRHVDIIWPLWSLFDLTPEGRGTDWHPRLSYER